LTIVVCLEILPRSVCLTRYYRHTSETLPRILILVSPSCFSLIIPFILTKVHVGHGVFRGCIDESLIAHALFIWGFSSGTCYPGLSDI